MVELIRRAKGNAVFRNVVWLGMGEVVSRLFLFALLIAIARVLGVHGYGMFAFGLSVASLVLVVAQFGIHAIFVRDATQDQKWEHAFPAFLTLSILSGLGGFLAMAGAAFFLSKETSIHVLFLFLGGYVAAMTVLEMMYAFFRAREEMRYEAVLKVLQAVLTVSLGAILLLLAPTSANVGLAYAGGAASALLVMIWIFWFRTRSIDLQISLPLFKTVLSRTWPLGLAGVFAVVYNSIDSVMLGALGQVAAVGWYNAAYRIVGAALIPAVFLGHSFLPALSKRLGSSIGSLQNLWERQVEVALMLGVPASVGGAIMAPRIIRALYPPEFDPAILALQILIWTVALTFFVSACSYMLLVAGQQTKSLWIVGMGAAGNVLLNMWLIPLWSLYGAAVATLATYVFLFFLYAEVTRRYTPARLFTSSLGKVLLAVGGGTGIMVAVLTAAAPFPFLLLLSLGGGVYLVSYGVIRRMLFGVFLPAV